MDNEYTVGALGDLIATEAKKKKSGKFNKT